MPTSSKFIPVCKQCKAFCCITARPPVTEKEKHAILEAGFKDYFVKVGNNIYDITSEGDEQCPYLKHDLSCEIHKVKPTLCAVWPVIPRFKNNQRDCIIIKCPIFPLLSKEELHQAKKAADTVPLPLIKHLWSISPKVKNKFKMFEYEKM
jgi:Fe-S-cluster containining protein